MIASNKFSVTTYTAIARKPTIRNTTEVTRRSERPVETPPSEYTLTTIESVTVEDDNSRMVVDIPSTSEEQLNNTHEIDGADDARVRKKRFVPF